jgi:hypothetical protein
MPRLNDDELEQIIRKDMPGYTVVSRGAEAPPAAAGPPPAADQIAADIHELRARYLAEAEPEADAREPELDADVEDDEEIVTVSPAGGPDPANPGARPKKVIVSAGQRRIVGSQG